MFTRSPHKAFLSSSYFNVFSISSNTARQQLLSGLKKKKKAKRKKWFWISAVIPKVSYTSVTNYLLCI